jgi:hypothetical protein
MIMFIMNCILFVLTLGVTYFAVVFISLAYDVNFADKEYTVVSIAVTALAFLMWTALYYSIT